MSMGRRESLKGIITEGVGDHVGGLEADTGVEEFFEDFPDLSEDLMTQDKTPTVMFRDPMGKWRKGELQGMDETTGTATVTYRMGFTTYKVMVDQSEVMTPVQYRQAMAQQQRPG